MNNIYRGNIWHLRTTPEIHKFSHPITFIRIDNDQKILNGTGIVKLGSGFLNFFTINTTDYLSRNGPSGELKSWIEKIYLCLNNNSNVVINDVTSITIATMPRFLGYIFNPVTFYFVNGEKPILISEVNNTFNEKHIYRTELLRTSTLNGVEIYRSNAQTLKGFHVSPFNDLKGEYDFQLKISPERISFRVNLIKNGKTTLLAKMSGSKMEGRARFFALLCYPFSSLLVFLRILFEAIVLYFIKGLRVYSKPIAIDENTIRVSGFNKLEEICLKKVVSFLAKIKIGSLKICVGDNLIAQVGQLTASDGESGIIEVKAPYVFPKLVLGGDIAFGEAYVEGLIDSPNLSKLLTIISKNREYMDDRQIITTYVRRILNRTKHLLRKNKLGQATKNIREHYDLSNDFFKIFLDSSMTYSSGLFLKPTDTLEQSQIQKRKLLTDKLQLKNSDKILEIGCGWGALGLDISKTGASYTGITLSKEQFLYCEKLKEDNHNLEFEIKDYRNVKDKYDKIVSIEMIEAVGHEYLPKFFNTAHKILNPNGLLVLQVITFNDRYYDSYRKSCDWIQKYIFPGGLCPALSAIFKASGEGGLFKINHLQGFGSSYAETLRKWSDKFNNNQDNIIEQGFDEEFIRKWNYYFSYCEAGFESGLIDVHQIVLEKI